MHVHTLSVVQRYAPNAIPVFSRTEPQKKRDDTDRDVGRTFPRQELFKSRNGPGQNLLANVLKACLKINPDVGYCQVRWLSAFRVLGSWRDQSFCGGKEGVV